MPFAFCLASSRRYLLADIDTPELVEIHKKLIRSLSTQFRLELSADGFTTLLPRQMHILDHMAIPGTPSKFGKVGWEFGGRSLPEQAFPT
jgi:hypothetical protein